MDTIKKEIAAQGYTTVNNFYSEEEVLNILSAVENTDHSNPAFRKTSDLFAIRRFLHEIPIVNILFTEKLQSLIATLFDSDYFIVKSIYFDKPELSNWFVAYHQDLTISVNTKTDIPGFGPWTVKQDQFGVQPPLDVLEKNFTIRIHLDHTDEKNGALRVIPGSHLKGIYRAETIDRNNEKEDTCSVNRGGIMIMKPLLLHASSRTTNNKKRRVIHIEFSKSVLPKPLQWSELIIINRMPVPKSSERTSE